MDLKDKFEQMRPYNNEEVETVVKRLVKYPELISIIRYIYSDFDEQEILKKFKQIKTVFEFQTFFSGYAVEQILNKTSDGFTHSGLEYLDKDKSYLFVANHRDIVMDSAIMQWLLKKNNFKTSQITFGSNLMSSQFIVDIGKLNKMFTFYRGGSRIVTYRNAVLHSAYIRDVIVNKKESVWIAQRDGRTKDGNDLTQPALLKMFLVRQNDFQKALLELNIVPVVISYELEPCDVSKINERYVKNSGKEYIKSKNEDFMSVLNGITGYKGRVNMSFAEPLNNFLSSNNKIKHLQFEDFVNSICEHIDKQVYQNFKLYPFNFIAYDRLNNNTKHLNTKYSIADCDKFDHLLKQKRQLINFEEQVFDKMFLEMYGSPVKNFILSNSK